MSAATTKVRLTRDGALGILTLDSPPFNLIGDELVAGLGTAIAEVEADAGLRALLVRGEGQVFSAGADVNLFAGRGADAMRPLIASFLDLGRRFEQLPFPTLAAVHGTCMAGGFELALFCDLIWAAEGTMLGLPEISIGSFLGGGITYLLPRLVGLAKAREMVFLGERIDGEEAARIGLASRVFPDEAFLDHARAFALEIAGKAPFSMQLAKEQLNLAAERTFDAALTAELEGMMFCSTTKDWQEGIDAFAEKRAPVFTGE